MGVLFKVVAVGTRKRKKEPGLPPSFDRVETMSPEISGVVLRDGSDTEIEEDFADMPGSLDREASDGLLQSSQEAFASNDERALEFSRGNAAFVMRHFQEHPLTVPRGLGDGVGLVDFEGKTFDFQSYRYALDPLVIHRQKIGSRDVASIEYPNSVKTGFYYHGGRNIQPHKRMEKPGRLFMEDSVMLEAYDGGILLSLCDGHGVRPEPGAEQSPGAVVSKAVSTGFSRHFKSFFEGDCAQSANRAIHRAALKVSEDLTSVPEARDSGSTGVLGYLKGDQFFWGNVGDSRVVLMTRFERDLSGGSEFSAKSGRRLKTSMVYHLSADHSWGEDLKALKPHERKRVKLQGGAVKRGLHAKRRTYVRDADSSFSVGLAPSRSFGHTGHPGVPLTPAPADISDRHGGVISATPDDYALTLHARDEFLIVACDGIWDVISPSRIPSIIANYKRVHKLDHISPEDVSKALLQKALEWRSFDNISIMVIDLRKK